MQKYPTWQRELKNDKKKRKKEGEKQNLRRERRFSSTNNVTVEKKTKRNEVEKYEEKTIKKEEIAGQEGKKRISKI